MMFLSKRYWLVWRLKNRCTSSPKSRARAPSPEMSDDVSIPLQTSKMKLRRQFSSKAVLEKYMRGSVVDHSGVNDEDHNLSSLLESKRATTNPDRKKSRTLRKALRQQTNLMNAFRRKIKYKTFRLGFLDAWFHYILAAPWIEILFVFIFVATAVSLFFATLFFFSEPFDDDTSSATHMFNCFNLMRWIWGAFLLASVAKASLTDAPTRRPDAPTSVSTPKPTPSETDAPTSVSTPKPTPSETDAPTSVSTFKPTPSETDAPTSVSTFKPTPSETDAPTATPTPLPTTQVPTGIVIVGADCDPSTPMNCSLAKCGKDDPLMTPACQGTFDYVKQNWENPKYKDNGVDCTDPASLSCDCSIQSYLHDVEKIPWCPAVRGSLTPLLCVNNQCQPEDGTNSPTTAMPTLSPTLPPTIPPSEPPHTEPTTVAPTIAQTTPTAQPAQEKSSSSLGLAISAILVLSSCFALVCWDRRRRARGQLSLFSAFTKSDKRPSSVVLQDLSEALIASDDRAVSVASPASSSTQGLSEHRAPSLPSSPSSSAYTAAAAASLASGLPVLGGVFGVIAEVAKVCAQAIDNVDNCNSVARRMSSLQQPLRSCERHFRAQGTIRQGQLDALTNLRGLLEQIKDLVSAYCDKGWIRRGIGSSTFKRNFENLDGAIDRCMADLQLGLGVEMIRQNNQILEQGRVVMVVDDKMNEQLEIARSTERKVDGLEGKMDEILQQGRKESQRESNRMHREMVLRMFEIQADQVSFHLGRGKEAWLGQGGFGKVYRVLFEGQLKACKVVQVGFSRVQRQKIIRDFERELTIMCSLRHHNIICVYGAAFASDELWLVMDLAEAGTARTLLDWLQAQQEQPDHGQDNGQGNQEGQADLEGLPDGFPARMRNPSCWTMFAPEDATLRVRMELALGTARAIAHLHVNKVQHRDLKSHNILLSRDGKSKKIVARVSDFGLSRAQTFLTSSTSGGLGKGTPAWSSPEHLQGAAYTDKSDIYSLGVVLWEILTLRKPWEGLTFLQIATKVVTLKQSLPLPDEEELEGDELRALRNVVAMCLSVSPEDRPTAAQVVKALC